LLDDEDVYTFGMKTAVSVPDEVFDAAERLARRTKRSRSRVFSDALREYVARHSPEEVTDAVNKACAEIGDTRDRFVAEAARHILERTEW
jgi:metal-responsive CopG/Arc/MetJ family transcriptional regulator